MAPDYRFDCVNMSPTPTTTTAATRSTTAAAAAAAAALRSYIAYLIHHVQLHTFST